MGVIMITVKQFERISLITDKVIEPFFSSLKEKYSASPPKNHSERNKLINKIVTDLLQEISNFQLDQPVDQRLEFSGGTFTRRTALWIDSQWPLPEETSLISRIFKLSPLFVR